MHIHIIHTHSRAIGSEIQDLTSVGFRNGKQFAEMPGAFPNPNGSTFKISFIRIVLPPL